LTSGNSIGAAPDYATPALITWASVSLLMLALMFRRQITFTHSLGNMTLMQDGTYRSASVRGPVLIGVWRSRVVLPNDFETLYSPEERVLVLAHEQAHWQRRDLLINAAATIWLGLAWFNPLMYWAVARFKVDQELACDAVVLAKSRTGRRRYAAALLKTQLVADSAWRMPIGCHWQSSHPLEERIAMLKRPADLFPGR
jgi:beta-lactamase regulating signal transducer with metallopeptidase domain